MAWRIYDVDAGIAPDQGGALGENGDPAFPLEIIGIHRPLGDLLVVAKQAGLAEQCVDQGRFAMVDVGDDRNIAEVHGGSDAALQKKKRAHTTRRAPALACPLTVLATQFRAPCST